MQLNITLSEIQHLATNGKIFTRGKQYAQNGYVQKMAYAPAHHLLLAYVRGDAAEKPYLVQVALSQRERPKRISCTCPASKEFQGCCEHMVAVFLAAQNLALEKMDNWNDRLPLMEERPTPNARAASADSQDEAPKKAAPRSTLLDRLHAQELRRSPTLDDQALADSDFRLKLHIRLPRLTPENCFLNFQLEASAESKLYKVKKPEQFLQQFLAGQPYKLTPLVSFDPRCQRCDEAGERFLAWLEELCALAVERNEGDYFSKSALFTDGALVLNPQRLWDFCERFAADFAALDLSFSRGTGEESRPLILQEHFPPLSFFWSATQPNASSTSKDGGPEGWRSLWLIDGAGQKVSVYSPLQLKAHEGGDDLRLLTRDARLLLYQNKIYRLSAAERPLYGLLLSRLAQSAEAALRIDPPSAQEFLSRIYPSLTREKRLQMAEPLRAQFVHSALRSLIWLDQAGSGLELRLFFYYAPFCHNPHPKQAGHWLRFDFVGESQAAELPEKARPVPCPELARDLGRESQFLAALKRLGFIEKRPPSRSGRGERGAASKDENKQAAYFLFGDQALLHFYSRGYEELGALGATLFLSQTLRRRPWLRVLPSLRGRLKFSSADTLLALELDDWPYSPNELQTILTAYREKRQFARLRDGSFVRWGNDEPAEPSPDAAGASAAGGANTEAGAATAEAEGATSESSLALLDRLCSWGGVLEGRQLVLPPYRALPLNALLREKNAAAHERGQAGAFLENSSLSEMRDELLHPSGLKFRPPVALAGRLRPYQVSGFDWLCSLDYYGLGGILADDMGLGKTVQALSFIAHIRQSRSEPVLVAAPTSLIYNWQSEAQKFVPELRLLLLDGQKSQRLAQIAQIPQFDLVICSYTILRQDIKELRALHFSACFIDEAQFIKNPGTQTAKAVKRIRAARRFALTGTPVENRLSELWSIFDFLMPGYLFSQARFQSEFELPISRDRNPDAVAELRLLTAPFILRRLKKEVLKELPDKIETRLSCEMGRTQEKLYLAYLAEAQKELRTMQAKDALLGSRMQLLTLITRLRQICCHPSLFLSHYEGGSAKLDVLDGLLDRLIGGAHSALIFSQFTAMLELTAKLLEARELPYFYLDGGVSARERLERVRRFNEGERPIFLISLKAGGTGLNLTRADCVIHLDPWWNPAVEDQASDRAHRIGQQRSVQIFRLVTRNSIEEKIMALQEEKRRLVAEIIQAEGDQLRSLSLDDLKALLD